MGPLAGLAIGGAGLIAGAINAIVGSGTLVTFPVLLAFGYPPLVANVSNTIGIVPGAFSGVHAYRLELSGKDQLHRAVRLGLFSVTGAVVGALLLFAFPGSAFRHVVPFLILLACALMALQPIISRRLDRAAPSPSGRTSYADRGGHSDKVGAADVCSHLPDVGSHVPDVGHVSDEATHIHEAGERSARRHPARATVVLSAAVFLTGVYGGYFGAGQGIVLIALLTIFVTDRIHRLIAIKNVLGLLANLVAGIIFAFSGKVSWGAAGVLAAGSVVGGQLGGRLGRRLPQQVLRTAVLATGTAVAIVLIAR